MKPSAMCQDFVLQDSRGTETKLFIDAHYCHYSSGKRPPLSLRSISSSPFCTYSLTTPTSRHYLGAISLLLRGLSSDLGSDTLCLAVGTCLNLLPRQILTGRASWAAVWAQSCSSGKARLYRTAWPGPPCQPTMSALFSP